MERGKQWPEQCQQEWAVVGGRGRWGAELVGTKSPGRTRSRPHLQLRQNRMGVDAHKAAMRVMNWVASHTSVEERRWGERRGYRTGMRWGMRRQCWHRDREIQRAKWGRRAAQGSSGRPRPAENAGRSIGPAVTWIPRNPPPERRLRNFPRVAFTFSCHTLSALDV